MPASQRVIWTVIPRGLNTSATPPRLRVSVVLSPRLEDTSPTIKKLADYPDWLDWPASLASIRFDIRFSNGTVIPWNQLSLLTSASSARWKAIFTDQTPVKPYQFPAIAQLPIASYPVKGVLALTEQLFTTIGQNALTDPPFLPLRRGDKPESWLSQLIQSLGELQFDEAEKDRAWRRARRLTLQQQGAIQFPPTPQTRETLEWAKYFHEPMAAENLPEPNPTFEKAYSPYKRVPIAKPKPDFHEVLSMLLDHPALQQQLGIQLVVEFSLPAGLPPTGWLQLVNLQWTPKMAATQITLPQTLYQLDMGQRLFLPQAPSGSELRNGLVDLSSPAYSLTTLDPDSSVHKLIAYAHTVRRVWQGVQAPFQSNKLLGGMQQATRESKDISTPTLRSVGIMLYRNNLAYALRQRLQRALALNTQTTGGTAPQLNYNDLLRGYRVDVWDSITGSWHSLCARRSEYNLLRSGDTSQASEEGTITLGTASRADAPPNELRLHEGFVTWKGWSLCVPRPGRTLDTENEDTPIDQPNEPLQDYQVRVQFRAEPGSLPRLRFGTRYRFRLRAVDVAGYSRSLDELNPSDFSMATGEVTYRRWEPIPVPALLLRQVPDSKTQRGEQLETMAIRCYNDTDDATSTTQTSERHIAAPRGSVELAEHHGKLDTAPGGKFNPDTYTLLVPREDTLPGGSAQFPSTAWTNPTTGEKVTLPVLPDPQAVTPYLPDPLGRAAIIQNVPGVPAGTTLWFTPDGSLQTTSNPGRYGCVIVNFGKASEWPDVPGFRLILAEGNGSPQWNPSDRTLTIFLPKGEERTLFYGTHFGADPAEAQTNVDLMAVYDLLNRVSPPIPKLTAAAVTGTSWMLTPPRKLTIVHAVQRPLAEPTFSSLEQKPLRTLGQTNAPLMMSIAYDGKSTSKIAVSAAWSSPVDNPAEDLPRDGQDGRPDAPVGTATVGEIITDDPTKSALTATLTHEFGDTRYRRVRYRATAVSRYREFFDKGMAEDKFIRQGPEKVVEILNSARPASIEALYAIPAFRWSRTQEGAVRVSERQPLTRVYIARPWYSSGEGELVGVVLPDAATLGGGKNLITAVFGKKALPEIMKPYVTQWGLDPIWLSAPVPSDIAPLQVHFANVAATQSGLSIEEVSDATVDVLGFVPRFDAERKLWYVDIELSPGESYFPFIRFALARFQPKSIEGAHLSRITQLDFIQILPRRTARIVLDGKRLRIFVEGHTYRAGAAVHASSEMEAVLEARMVQSPDPALGWEPIWSSSLSRHESRSPGFWAGELSLEDLPGTYAGKPLRVVLKEYEQWFADAPLTPEQEKINFGSGTGLELLGTLFTRRLVYADAIEV
ncbi:MAG: hypothetical protein NZ481_08515 [Candidatus Kapabacteria bacterium]|nr:hypothetical protein [Candidatus Kapabacteria bacterium]